MDFVFRYLKEHDVEYKRNFELKEISSIKIGGVTPVIIYPKTENELINLIRYFTKMNARYKIIGRATNLLFPDGEYPIPVISTKHISKVKIEGETVRAQCGASITKLINFSKSRSLGGLEALFGIPASVAGAVYGNAGAHNYQISDFIKQVKVFSPSFDETFVLSSDKLSFSYRKSVFQKNSDIILSADFCLSNKDESIIFDEIKKYINLRRASQPLDKPSLGSVFKRHGNIAISRLIDELGFKSFSVGGAQISNKHAGFIINSGSATAEDVKRIIEVVKTSVRDRYGIIPELEIEILN